MLTSGGPWTTVRRAVVVPGGEPLVQTERNEEASVRWRSGGAWEGEDERVELPGRAVGWVGGDCDGWGQAKRTSFGSLPGLIVWVGLSDGIRVGFESELLELGENLRTVRSPADHGTVGGSCQSVEPVLGDLCRFRPAPVSILVRVVLTHCWRFLVSWRSEIGTWESHLEQSVVHLPCKWNFRHMEGKGQELRFWMKVCQWSDERRFKK